MQKELKGSPCYFNKIQAAIFKFNKTSNPHAQSLFLWNEQTLLAIDQAI